MEDVNRSSEIREFLVSRRARITPQQAGLLAYGANRRVKGLRREEVAMLAGVSVDYYTRLERGNLAGASESVLDRTGRKDLHHPVAGDLDLTYEAFGLPSEPGLTMLVCTAEPGTPTAEALGFLASWAATQQAEAGAHRS